MKKILDSILGWFFFFLFIWGMMFFAADSVEVIHPDAIVYIDRESKEYFAPLCLESGLYDAAMEADMNFKEYNEKIRRLYIIIGLR